MTVLEYAFVVLLAGIALAGLGIAAIVIYRMSEPDQPEHHGADEAYGAELLDQRLEALTGEQTVVIDPVPAAPLPYPHFPDLPPFDDGLLSFTTSWSRVELDEKIRRAEEQAQQAGLVTR